MTSQKLVYDAEFLLVGDLAFAESYTDPKVKRSMQEILLERGYEHCLANFAELMNRVDAVIANLETPLTLSCRSPYEGTKKYLHWSHPQRSIETLKGHNVKLVSLANNHAMDYGSEALRETLAHLSAGRILHVGAGMDSLAAARPGELSLQLGERPFRLVILAAFELRRKYQRKLRYYAEDDEPGVHPLEMNEITSQIRQIKSRDPSAFVLVYPHWGRDYEEVNSIQVRMGRQMIDAGADLVVGHGAHRLQRIDRHRHRWILNGLGNFVFNSPGRYGKLGVAPYGLVTKLKVMTQGGSRRFQLLVYPILTDNRVTDYQSRFVSEAEFQDVIEMLFPGDAWHREGVAQGQDEFGRYLQLNLDEARGGETH